MQESIIRTFEELSLNAWPALQTKLYDGWILRFANGYTKRSNSINPIYHSALPLQEKIEACEAEYEKSRLPVVFKLTDESCPQGIDNELAERNYLRIDETSVRVLAMSQYRYRNPARVLIEDKFSDTWLQDFINCSNIESELLQRTAQEIVHHILGKVIVARKVIDGQTVACGYGAIERGHIGIFDIIVAKDYRGKGFGQDIMDGILSAAMDEPIEKAYLSVVVGNVPAENLYLKLGFQEIYRYWYRKKEG